MVSVRIGLVIVAALMVGLVFVDHPPPVTAHSTSSGNYLFNRVAHSNKCMNVSGGSTANGAVIIQWSCVLTNNNLWRVDHQADGYHTLKVKHSGKCLDAPLGAGAGAQLQQWDCHGGDNQRWDLQYVFGDASYRLRNKYNGLCVDVYGASQGDGTAVIQWYCHTGNNQRWFGLV